MIGNNESFNVSGLELNSPGVQYIRGRNPDIPQKFSRSSLLASVLAPGYTNLAPLVSFQLSTRNSFGTELFARSKFALTWPRKDPDLTASTAVTDRDGGLQGWLGTISATRSWRLFAAANDVQSSVSYRFISLSRACCHLEVYLVQCRQTSGSVTR